MTHVVCRCDLLSGDRTRGGAGTSREYGEAAGIDDLGCGLGGHWGGDKLVLWRDVGE